MINSEMDPRLVRQAELYYSNLRENAICRIDVPPTTCTLVVPREMGGGINGDSLDSKNERLMRGHGLHAELRRAVISDVLGGMVARQELVIDTVCVAMWPDADLPEKDQNIDAMLALGAKDRWLTLVNFYCKVYDAHYNEVFEMRNGLHVMSPSLIMGRRPIDISNPNSSNSRYFPDAPNTYDWREVERNDEGLRLLSLATGYSDAQLARILAG